MSLKNDLMFPFGNPYRDKLENRATITALGNVLKLAKDKMRAVNGEPEDILIIPESADAYNAQLSIKEIEELIEFINGKKETIS